MIRWGILGTSFISDTMAEVIRASGASEIVAVAGRDGGRAGDFATRFAIPHVAFSYEALIADPRVDAVYIGLPNHVHHTYTIMAAQHGKHVLSEKSLSTDMDKADQMLMAVAEAGIFFVEGLMYRAHPVIERLVALLKDGRIGGLRSINALYAADIARFVNPQSRGALYNLGCYPVSLMQLVVDTMGGSGSFAAREIRAFGARSITDGNIADAVAAVRFDNGVLATVATSETHGMTHEFTVTGDRASLRFRTNPWLPVAGDNVIEVISHETGGFAELITVRDDNDAFHHQLKRVEAAIRAGDREAAAPSPGHAESRAIMAFLADWEAACGN